MKFISPLALLTLLAGQPLHAQTFGIVNLTNGPGSLVTNGLTGALVSLSSPSNSPVRVSLYYAADGVTDEAGFVRIGNSAQVGIPTPGRYAGGYIPLTGIAAGGAAMIQVRAFESNYGETYEAALDGPVLNGRRALVGKSAIARVIVDGPFGSSQTPRVGSLVGPIALFPAGGTPLITGNDLTAAEGSNGTATATFIVRLNAPASGDVRVDFATTDGTALAGTDYVSTNGTLIFLPGETSKAVPVTLLADEPPEDAETFSLRLSNPVGALIQQGTMVCTIVEVRISGVSVDTSVTFNTLVGRRYTVEKSTDGLHWFPLAGLPSTLTATGSSLTVTDRGTGCQQIAIYRASLLP